MPKLNATHLPARIQDAIEKLERGEEVEPKKNKSLLNDEQRKALDDAWAVQQALRKTHKPPKTEEEKQRIGWKTIREVRIEIYKQALEQLQANVVDDIRELQKQREVKANRVFMDAWSDAVAQGKRGISAESAGNIALQRAGFSVGRVVATKRDKEVWAMEDELKKRFEAEMTDEEREQHELIKESEKALRKGLRDRKR
jgi:hypothetical protein